MFGVIHDFRFEIDAKAFKVVHETLVGVVNFLFQFSDFSVFLGFNLRNGSFYFREESVPNVDQQLASLRALD